MSSPTVRSVNVGRPRQERFPGRTERTAIRKQPVTGPVAVHEHGLEGDQVADTRHHGGTFQAVYAFASEDLALWAGRVESALPPGFFGENLTTSGIDVNEALVGERWRVGTALLEVVSVRIPCNTFKGWMGAHDLDDTAWVKRFTAEGRPGPYLRVREQGVVTAGDPVVVEHRPDHDVTVSTLFRALTTDRELLPLLVDLECIDPQARNTARAYVAAEPRGPQSDAGRTRR
ncbi:MAG: MOSC domain-containing protein [Nocardioides sp.]